MDQAFQLGKAFNCRCGKEHDVPVRSFCYLSGIIDSIVPLISEALDRQTLPSCVVVADSRTWKVCGEAVSRNLSAESIIVPDSCEQGPVCDDSTCHWLKQQFSAKQAEMVIAVGSGTISDLCKWASFEMDLPYAVVATAASMNGYAAANVAAKIDGVKLVFRARPPVAVLAEPNIIEQSPTQMTASGFADTVAKFQSKADWVMNNLLFGEDYCGYCADILQDVEGSYLDSPEKLRTGDPEAVKGLFEALFLTGIAMTMVGTSTPASGGEHLLSHVLDMTADINNQGHWLHGLQVGLGTIVSAALYEKILSIDEPALHEMPEDIDTAYWQDERLIRSVKEQYTLKTDAIKAAKERIVQPKIYKQLKARLQSVVKPPLFVKDLLHRAGAAGSITDLNISREQIKEAMLHTHEIRKRFSVVDLAWLTGVLPASADDIIDTYLI